jgi:drug/metabolite transporter (DMT)-like permease
MPPAPADPRLHRKGIALAVVAMLVISPDAMLIRLMHAAGPWDIAFYRTLLMGTALAAYLLIRHGRAGTARAFRSLGRLGLFAGVLQGVTQICFVSSITQTDVANTLVILATMPLFAALIGWVALREAVAARTAAAIAVAFAGILVIFSGSLGAGNLAGDLLALTAAACLGGNLVLLRHAGPGIILPVLCLGGFVGAAISVWFADPLAVPAHDLALLGYMGLVQTPLAFILFFNGTRFVPAAEIALMSLIETMLGPFWAWLAVGETPTEQAVAGGTLVLAAIALNSALAMRPFRKTSSPSLE